MTRVEHDEPLACTLTGNEQIGRRDRWLRLAELALVTKTATEAGVELRYRAGPAVLVELTELAGLETECCGFAEWKVTEASDSIRLEVETEPTKAPAIWAMFDESPPAVTGAIDHR
ncbi:MAG: hypothetical protein ACR2ML_03390 [Solirubrobacteraceae bacterium]